MKNLIQLLDEYLPYFPEEKSIKEQMLAFLSSYDNVFSRKQNFGHFTASGFLLNSDCSQFLLMHHKKLNIWVQPGGHSDGEEDLLKVAMTEASEESGIAEIIAISNKIFDIDIHKIPANKYEKEHFHFDVRFLLKTKENNSLKKNFESYDLKWVSFDCEDYQEFSLQRSVVRMIEKYKSEI